MAIKYNLELTERREGKHVLIDADCVAYWAAATCDQQSERVASRRVDHRINQILDDCRAAECTNYLTGQGNFRDAVATLQRYKGNRYRDDGSRITPQPKWLPECREYLIEEHDAILIHGCEADDALGIHRAKFPWGNTDYIISSIDKDLRINFGYHHNQNTGKIIRVLPIMQPLDVILKTSPTTGKVTKKVAGVGLMFFWYQMLVGDSADWIKGLPGVTKEMQKRWPKLRMGGCGPMAAVQILQGCETEQEAEGRVWFCYKSYWKQAGYTHWKTQEEFKAGVHTARKQFIEQMQLLWMRTEENQMRMPKYELK